MNTRNTNNRVVTQGLLPVVAEVIQPVLEADFVAEEGWQVVNRRRGRIGGGRRGLGQPVGRNLGANRRAQIPPVVPDGPLLGGAALVPARRRRREVTFEGDEALAEREVVPIPPVVFDAPVVPVVAVPRGRRRQAARVETPVDVVVEVAAQPRRVRARGVRRRVDLEALVPASDDDVDLLTGGLPDFPVVEPVHQHRKKKRGSSGAGAHRGHVIRGQDVVLDLSSGDESLGSQIGFDSPASLGRGDDAMFPRIDRWLVDVRPFKVSFLKSKMFVSTRALEFGWLVGIFSGSGEILTMYQHGGNWLTHVGVSSEFPDLAQIPISPASGFLVLSELGVRTMLSRLKLDSLCAEPTWPLETSFIDFNSVFGVAELSSGVSSDAGDPRRHFRELFESESFGPSAFLKDVSTLGQSSQSKFTESRPLRVMCGNLVVRWKALAGEFCQIDASSTLKNALFLVPEPLKLLPVCGPIRLAELLLANFVTVKFALQYPSPPKKGEGSHLGFFLFPYESFRSVAFCKKALDRLVRLLGSIFSDVDFWRSVFERISDVLSDVCERNMASWDVAYVFNWLNLKLFNLGHFLVQESSTVLSRVELLVELGVLLAFSFPEEQSLFLGSLSLGRQPPAKSSSAPKGGSQFPPRFPQAVSSSLQPAVASLTHPSGGQSRYHVPAGAAASSAPPDKWCINHVAHCIGARASPCSGTPSGACPWAHPVVPLPLSVPHKEALKNLAQSIKPSAFKSKFLSLIA